MSLQVPSAFKFWCILFKKRVNIVAKAVSIYVFNMLNSINNFSFIACFVINPELLLLYTNYFSNTSFYQYFDTTVRFNSWIYCTFFFTLNNIFDL